MPDGSGRMSLSPLVRWQVFRRDGFRCGYCRAIGVPLQGDHIIPRVAGGSDAWHNLLTACSECNLGKGAIALRPTVEELAGALCEAGVISGVTENVQATLIRLSVLISMRDLARV